MNAFVYIVFALGCVQVLEAKEQLSVTDFFLDFLLSLWVPPTYAPSQDVQDISDPTLKEQMISVEKSRTALENYIQHLLRYANENPNHGNGKGADFPLADALNNFSPDSSQASPYADHIQNCNHAMFGCNYVDSLAAQLYPNANLVATPTTMSDVPNPAMLPLMAAYANQGQPPNIDMTPSKSLVPEIHSAHFHQNTFRPTHIHYPTPPPGFVEYQPPLEQNTGTFSQADLKAQITSDSIATLLPELLGQASNVVPDFESSDESMPDCDPSNPMLYNSNACIPPIAPLNPYGYGAAKRDTPNHERYQQILSQLGAQTNPAWSKSPMSMLAEKILYLAKDNNIAKGITGPRMLGTILVQNPEILDRVSGNKNSFGGLDDSNRKRKRENNLVNNKKETRMFEDRYLPNNLYDVLRSPRHPVLQPQFGNDASNGFVNVLTKRTLGTKLDTKESTNQGVYSREGPTVWRTFMNPTPTPLTVPDNSNHETDVLPRQALPPIKHANLP